MSGEMVLAIGYGSIMIIGGLLVWWDLYKPNDDSSD